MRALTFESRVQVNWGKILNAKIKKNTHTPGKLEPSQDKPVQIGNI